MPGVGGPGDVAAPAGAIAAEAVADFEAERALRRYVDVAGAQLGEHQRDLSRLELATRNLEATWLFPARDDTSLAMEDGVPLTLRPAHADRPGAGGGAGPARAGVSTTDRRR